MQECEIATVRQVRCVLGATNVHAFARLSRAVEGSFGCFAGRCVLLVTACQVNVVTF